jgi:hypothetical protein
MGPETRMYDKGVVISKAKIRKLREWFLDIRTIIRYLNPGNQPPN